MANKAKATSRKIAETQAEAQAAREEKLTKLAILTGEVNTYEKVLPEIAPLAGKQLKNKDGSLMTLYNKYLSDYTSKRDKLDEYLDY